MRSAVIKRQRTELLGLAALRAAVDPSRCVTPYAACWRESHQQTSANRMPIRLFATIALPMARVSFTPRRFVLQLPYDCDLRPFGSSCRYLHAGVGVGATFLAKTRLSQKARRRFMWA